MLEALVQSTALRIKEDGAQISTQILCVLYSIHTHTLKVMFYNAFRAPWVVTTVFYRKGVEFQISNSHIRNDQLSKMQYDIEHSNIHICTHTYTLYIFISIITNYIDSIVIAVFRGGEKRFNFAFHILITVHYCGKSGEKLKQKQRQCWAYRFAHYPLFSFLPSLFIFIDSLWISHPEFQFPLSPCPLTSSLYPCNLSQ